MYLCIVKVQQICSSRWRGATAVTSPTKVIDKLGGGQPPKQAPGVAAGSQVELIPIEEVGFILKLIPVQFLFLLVCGLLA